MTDSARYQVKLEDLRKVCKPEDLVVVGANLDIPIELVGQERVKKALELILSGKPKRHLVIVAQDFNPQAVKTFIESKIKGYRKGFQFSDYCYVYNFADPAKPILIELPAGEGKKFKELIEGLLDKAESEIPKALPVDEFQKEREKLLSQFKAKVKRAFSETVEKLESQGISNSRWKQLGWIFRMEEEKGDIWLQVALLDKEGKPLTTEEDVDKFLASLSEEEFKSHKENYMQLQNEIDIVSKAMREIHDTHNQERESALKELEDARLEKVFDFLFKDLLRDYFRYPKVVEFLSELKDYLWENSYIFPQHILFGNPDVLSQRHDPDEEDLLPVKVNLIVDNAGRENPPVSIGTNLSYAELLGTIEKKTENGSTTTITNHTLIRPGLFHSANGGFLILDLTDIAIAKESIYLAIRNTLKWGELRLHSPEEEYGLSSDVPYLSPEPISLNLQVIAILNPDLYYSFWDFILDEGLVKLFEIGRFTRFIDYKSENLTAYSVWMDDFSQKENLGSLTQEARAKIIEFLLRAAESQKEFIADVETIKALIREASLYVKEGKISEKEVNRAIQERINRRNLYQERRQEFILNGQMLIETQGERVGQINGLVVSTEGDYSFGGPERITVAISKGEEGVIDIDRICRFAGDMTIKGVEALKGFFHQRYGQKKDISFTARISFEEVYDEFDGPSASGAELFVLVSGLAGVPIRQGIAVTGVIDQRGFLRTIGGVNEKIEGFYGICKARGFSGQEGVMIPKSNVQDLMLKEEVIEDIKAGRFNVWAVERYEEGIEVLTGFSALQIDKLVERKLRTLSRRFWIF